MYVIEGISPPFIPAFFIYFEEAADLFEIYQKKMLFNTVIPKFLINLVYEENSVAAFN